jgi:hypothetical protein
VTWRRGTVLVGLAVAVFALASCMSGTANPCAPPTTFPLRDATVVGVYGIEGGPAPGLFHPFSKGLITLQDGEGSYGEHVASNGHFRFITAPGTYQVTGYTGVARTDVCGHATVNAKAHKTASVRVVCIVP